MYEGLTIIDDIEKHEHETLAMEAAGEYRAYEARKVMHPAHPHWAEIVALLDDCDEEYRR